MVAMLEDSPGWMVLMERRASGGIAFISFIPISRLRPMREVLRFTATEPGSSAGSRSLRRRS